MQKPSFAIAFIAIIFLSLINSSCNKESDYYPSKRIAKLYFQHEYKSFYMSENIEKFLLEIWTWDKKRLSHIDCNGWSLNFSYHKRKLSEINSGDQTFSFTYDHDNKFQKMEGAKNGKVFLTIHAKAYDENKITRLAYISDNFLTLSTNSLDGKPHSPVLKITYQNLFMELVNNDIAKKGNLTKELTKEVIFDLKYKNDNVSEIKIIYADGSETDFLLEYDNKSNPYYLSSHEFDDFNFPSYSKNNITSIYYKDSHEIMTKYDYSYQGDWPTKQIDKRSWIESVYDFDSDSFVDHESYMISTTFYEYEN